MSRFAILSVLLIVVLGCLGIQSVEPRDFGHRLHRIMARHGLTQAVVAYGFAGREPHTFGVDARVGQEFPYYSLAKPMTAHAVLSVLNLDEQIEGASVRQLLQHTGGWDRAIAGDPVTRADAGVACTALPVPAKQFEPGTRYAYSNLGYCLLGRRLAERMGRSYEDAMHVLLPETRAMHFDPVLGPAGGWSGTVDSYFQFASREIPAATYIAPVPRPNDLPYGLGWALGSDFVTHFGVFPGNFSVVVRQGDFVAVALFSGRPRNDQVAARDLREALLELHPPLSQGRAGDLFATGALERAYLYVHRVLRQD